MSHVARSILLACWWALGSALAPVCIAATISPSSVAQATAVSAGVNSWTIGDAAGTWDALRAMTTTPSSVSSSGALTVQAAAKVPTKHGAVDAVIKREIPYSKLVSPWKKALRVVPLVGTGLAIKELLEEMCIRPTGEIGVFEQCVTSEQYTPAMDGFCSSVTACFSTPQSALADYMANAAGGPWTVESSTPNSSGGITYTLRNSAFSTLYAIVEKSAVCRYGKPPIYAKIGPAPAYQRYCETQVIESWQQVGPQQVDEAIDQFPTNHPDKLQQQVPKLWGDLHNRPEGTPLDQRSVDATGLSSPTITPKTPADTAKAGPKTTETTSTGTKVTQETSTITYQGDKTTVTNNTTVTNINNEGDIVDESTTTEQGPTDCEKNPSAIGCLELGEPPTGEVPRKDENWQITAESLPGGACPGGFVWPVPGNPEFSWQPLCDQLPKVRAVVLVLASVLAAWIVVGGFQS